jgi:hypothetical protein
VVSTRACCLRLLPVQRTLRCHRLRMRTVRRRVKRNVRKIRMIARSCQNLRGPGWPRVNDLIAESQVLSSTHLRVECEDQLDIIFPRLGRIAPLPQAQVESIQLFAGQAKETLELANSLIAVSFLLFWLRSRKPSVHNGLASARPATYPPSLPITFSGYPLTVFASVVS